LAEVLNAVSADVNSYAASVKGKLNFGAPPKSPRDIFRSLARRQTLPIRRARRLFSVPHRRLNRFFFGKFCIPFPNGQNLSVKLVYD
jgi:hypothetical protein